MAKSGKSSSGKSFFSLKVPILTKVIKFFWNTDVLKKKDDETEFQDTKQAREDFEEENFSLDDHEKPLESSNEKEDSDTEKETIEQPAEDSEDSEDFKDSEDSEDAKVEPLNQIAEEDQGGGESSSVATEDFEKEEVAVAVDSDVIDNKDEEPAEKDPEIAKEQILDKDKPASDLEEGSVAAVDSKKSKFNEKLKTVYVKKDNVYRKEEVVVEEIAQELDNKHQENKDLSLFDDELSNTITEEDSSSEVVSDSELTTDHGGKKVVDKDKLIISPTVIKPHSVLSMLDQQVVSDTISVKRYKK